jgi:hypothetical protein
MKLEGMMLDSSQHLIHGLTSDPKPAGITHSFASDGHWHNERLPSLLFTIAHSPISKGENISVHDTQFPGGIA